MARRSTRACMLGKQGCRWAYLTNSQRCTNVLNRFISVFFLHVVAWYEVSILFCIPRPLPRPRHKALIHRCSVSISISLSSSHKHLSLPESFVGSHKSSYLTLWFRRSPNMSGVVHECACEYGTNHACILWCRSHILLTVLAYHHCSCALYNRYEPLIASRGADQPYTVCLRLAVAAS